ncbi:MAG: DUF2330 domain-containing protein [Myxococcales bacterium]
MRSLLALAALCAALPLLLSPARALACGGAFGANMTIDASQTLLVAHRSGTETYVFRPHFCGEAAQFGLILPIPSALAGNPALAEAGLFDDLETVSAPKHVARTECRGRVGPDGGLAHGASDAGVTGPAVIDHGQVGIFDWVLLKADSSASFTAWLDANGFPHDASAEPLFAHYVAKGWFFVAFKVTAGEEAPPEGTRLCGDFGPIQLSFPAATPVVPTRIAAASAPSYSSLRWRIYALGDQQLSATGTDFYATTRFAGGLDSATLAGLPKLSVLARAGDRLSKLDVTFSPSAEADLALGPVENVDYRETLEDITYVDCPGDPDGPGGGCSTTGPGVLPFALSALTLLPLLGRRRRR